MDFSTRNVNVGDKVICTYSGGTKLIGTVVKKTPSGLVDVSFGNFQERFRKDGSAQKGSLWGNRWIEYCTEEKRKKIAETKRRKELAYEINACKFSEFSIDGLEAIWEICKKEMPKKGE